MSRYRVFDKERKSYTQPQDWSLGTQSGKVRGIYGEEFPEMITEEFTGFKDKNGKDIYDGDFLSEHYESDGITKTSYQRVYWCDKKGAWMLDHTYQKDCSSGDLLSEELEQTEFWVGGNICENPEFMNPDFL